MTRPDQDHEQDIPAPRLLLTMEQAAERLGVGRTLLYALAKDGEIETVTIGRLRRVPATALDTYVARLRTTGSEAA